MSRMINKWSKRLKWWFGYRNTLVFTFGRFNPIHKGHEHIIETVMFESKWAWKRPIKHLVVLSNTWDKKDNPLYPTMKLAILKRMFPATDMEVAGEEFPTLAEYIKHYGGLGYTDLIYVVGADREQTTKTFLKKYAKKWGWCTYRVSVVPRPEDSISATKMRQYARGGEFCAFRENCPDTMAETDKVSMYYDIRKRYGLK